MSPENLRKQFVPMDEIIDAMDSHGDSPRWYLDTETGEVIPWIDPTFSGEENPFDPDDERFVTIPQRQSGDEYRAMEDFVDEVEEEDVRNNLRRAITGKGAFRRFRDELEGYPDLRAKWEQEKRTRLVKEAIDWLAEIGIDPEFQLRPLPAPRPTGRPQAPAGKAQIGLLDMLLVGAPDGKTELLNGRVRRVFLAADAGQARKVFASLARELCEYHGLAWRRRFIEDRHDYEVDRCRLTVSDRRVELSVAVSPAVWRAFAS